MTTIEVGHPELSWQAANARRLTRHGLAGDPFPGPVEAARGICGAHAQIQSAAEISLALRTPDGTRSTVREALWDHHNLIRAYGPRGTIHLLPTDDLPMWNAAMRAMIPVTDAYTGPEALTPDQDEQVITAIGEVLANAELTADELTPEIVARTGSWAGDLVTPYFQGHLPRWRQAMWRASYRGVMCFAAPRGRKTTYTSPARWLGDRPAVDEETALTWLTRSFLAAYGPVTPGQYAQWLAVRSIRWARQRFESLGSEVDRVRFAGEEAWQLVGDRPGDPTLVPSVRLLPYFDAFPIGCHPRGLLFPDTAQRALAAGQAGNFPVVVVEGRVAGVWHQRRSGRRVNLTVELFGSLTPAQQRGLTDQVARVGEILEATPRLTFDTLPVGLHA